MVTIRSSRCAASDTGYVIEPALGAPWGLRSLRGLTAAFLLAFLAITATTGIGIYILTQQIVDDLVDQRIKDESGDLVASGAAVVPVALAGRIDALTKSRDTGDLGVELVDGAGRRIAGNVIFNRSLPLGFSALGKGDGIEGLSNGRALVRDLGGGLRLTVAAETEPFDHYAPARLRVFLIGFGSIIATVFVATLLFTQTIRRRIVDMRRTVEAIIDGDMRSRVPVDGSGSAFDQQAVAFNRMLDRIGVLMDQIGNVSNDIAHELRTPLTRLHQRLGLLNSRGEAEALREDLDGALADANELLGMFGALLRIAEIEGGARRAGFRTVDLADICRDVATMMEAVAAEQEHILSVDVPDVLLLPGDPQLLGQMIVNLVENSLAHTPAGCRIDIGLVHRADAVLLTVSDDGPGIAEEARERALTRFGRARTSRGHGLGLPLVEAIARLHRGSLVLEDAGPGLSVCVLLPPVD
jgi:signal transduction histidine kinase